MEQHQHCRQQDLEEVEEGMHWDPTWHAGWVWMHLLWWVFWLAMAALVWLIIDRSTKGPGGGTTL
jgi:hypothetical protein